VFADGTNTVTDNGNGTVTGTPAGTGTINYDTGAFSLTSIATSAAVTCSYSHWNNVAVSRTFANSVEPMHAMLRNDGVTGGYMMQVSDDGTNWKSYYAAKLTAYQNHNLPGIVPMKFFRVYTNVTGRVTGQAANLV
jgi:hypothetical protein